MCTFYLLLINYRFQSLGSNLHLSEICTLSMLVYTVHVWCLEVMVSLYVNWLNWISIKKSLAGAYCFYITVRKPCTSWKYCRGFGLKKIQSSPLRALFVGLWNEIVKTLIAYAENFTAILVRNAVSHSQRPHHILPLRRSPLNR